MQAINSTLESIERKIRKLIKRNEVLADENKTLIEENIKLKKELKDILLSTPRKEAGKSEDIVTAFSDDERVDTVKKELDTYIQEVNECINLLQG